MAPCEALSGLPYRKKTLLVQNETRPFKNRTKKCIVICGLCVIQARSI